MDNGKNMQDQPNYDPEEDKIKVLNETFRQAKHDSALKAALKLEKQPVTADELSPIHNTWEIGTTGGDQRASESELEKAEP